MKMSNLAVTLIAVISLVTIEGVYGDCCNFETDSCYWNSTSWVWSGNELPDPPPPYHPGRQYMWTRSNGATLESTEVTVPAESTVFSLTYYLKGQTGLDSLLVSFSESGSSVDNVQADLINTGEGWSLATFDCTPKSASGSAGCCTEYPCSGKMKLTATTTNGILFAVDDTGFNGDCGNSLPCCHFDDTLVCGFSNDDAEVALWHSSGDSPPDYNMIPSFTETDGYIWYQAKDSPGKQIFRSPLLNITSTEEITNRIYAYTDNETNGNLLEIQFYNLETNLAILLDYAITSSDDWMTLVVMCSSPHGNCCGKNTTCPGYLEYAANVITGEAFYAVDSVSFSACSAPQIVRNP